MLGELSARHESNGDAGCISSGYGDAGGQSYGAYQFAFNTGTPQAFVSWLVNNNESIGVRLAQFSPGSSDFDNEWITIAEENKENFYNLQHNFVKSQYYDVAYQLLLQIGIDLNRHSFALQNVVWSASVQYGNGYIQELFQTACKNLGYPNCSYVDSKEFDDKLISAIYVIRASDEWTSGSPTLRPGLRNRFELECKEALEMLVNSNET